MTDVLDYDVTIVGAGPAGLSAAIRLKQRNADIRVCVLEKGAAPGAHILSGCVFDPKALAELLPDYAEKNAPLGTPATSDHFAFFTKNHRLALPLTPAMRNEGCHVLSLSQLTRWLATQAEALGVDIFSGFAAVDVRMEKSRVTGVITGAQGVAKDGSHKPNHQPGVHIAATHTLVAEGCRGQLAERLMRLFDLRTGSDPQSYGLGIKEIWQIDPADHRPGKVEHHIGWPLNRNAYGGGFVYHMAGNRLAIGLITGLDYENPTLDPYAEFQRYKTHPTIRPLLERGKRIAYGARALNEGGWQALPQMAFPGGAIIGCAAGTLNAARIKGSHLAIASGMMAANAIIDQRLSAFSVDFRRSAWGQELKTARNLRPGFAKFGLYGGMLHAALDQIVFRGNAPWTLNQLQPDHARLKPASQCKTLTYPAPDGSVTFDRMSSVYLSNTHHEENQPCHLILRDSTIPERVNYPVYDGPEARYCPAGVYEYVEKNGSHQLHINAANCVHCKTCDIKDPTQTIRWIAPEGGGGPNYVEM